MTSCDVRCIAGFCQIIKNDRNCKEEFVCKYRECTRKSECTEIYSCTECKLVSSGGKPRCQRNCPEADCDLESGRCGKRNRVTNCPASACESSSGPGPGSGPGSGPGPGSVGPSFCSNDSDCPADDCSECKRGNGICGQTCSVHKCVSGQCEAQNEWRDCTTNCPEQEDPCELCKGQKLESCIAQGLRCFAYPGRLTVANCAKEKYSPHGIDCGGADGSGPGSDDDNGPGPGPGLGVEDADGPRPGPGLGVEDADGPGPGPGPCEGDDCTHTECRDVECITVDGVGRNECSGTVRCGDPLEHTICVDAQCRAIFGPGDNQCATDIDCPPVGKYLTCANAACRIATGVGPNRCVNDSDCVGQSSSSEVSRSSSSEKETVTTDDDDGAVASSSSSSEKVIPAAPTVIAQVAGNSICGDGVLAFPEECDDSNRRDDDGCSSTCYSEIGVCGDGKIQSQLGEQCESSVHASTLPYGCSNCRNISPTCNNKIVDPGEECDLGAQNSNAPNADCRRDCSLPRCGDKIIDDLYYEECDDGNRLNDDGCNRHCEKEDSIEIAFPDTPKSQIAGEQISFIHSLSPQQQSQLLLGMNIPPTQSNIDLLKQGKIKLSDQQTMVLAQQMRSLHALPYQMPYQSPYQMPYQSSYQIPLAQLRPLVQSRGPIGDTGPAAVAVIGAGAAAGIGWMRRRKK